MPKDEPLAHIARDPLPWRADGDNDTECGKPISEFAKVITFAEAEALRKKHGVQRAAFLLCMNCNDTTRRYGFASPTGQGTFDEEPTARISREFGRRREQMDRELRALAELARVHRREFNDLMEGRVVPIAELRRTTPS